ILTEDEQKKIENAFSLKSIKKGDYLIKEGQICHHIAYVKSGMLRVYYYDDENLDEVTCHLAFPDTFISSFTSFLTQTSTRENIAAIENSEILMVNRCNLEKLSGEIPKLHIWRRVMAENLFIMMEKRILMLQSHDAYERYRQMLLENPDIILNVPLQYTASFLGITPQHLSRIRKKIIS
ncbi:Crp/Fnr family transcriptional regulator, partial [Xanthovirga aplysinae]|uniref:Crp/Fnr family transcriptional regulator n=1 Tax=Xanthovirga aplysinae TaxID=2529853 RepID=UPI0012BB88A2